MSSPNPVGPNDPRGNREESSLNESPLETTRNTEDVEGSAGPNDPRGNTAAATSAD